jgi:hypothetical protein
VVEAVENARTLSSVARVARQQRGGTRRPGASLPSAGSCSWLPSADFFEGQRQFSYPIRLPDARVSAGEFFVTNSRGNSATRRMCWTATVDSGLRTLSGGQIAFQIEGPLAVETGATPPLVVQASHSVRDIFALLNEAPAGVAVELRVLQNDVVYCDLAVQPGSTVSNVISGFGLPPLAGDARLTLDVMAVGQGADNTPGRDLTVTIRL